MKKLSNVMLLAAVAFVTGGLAYGFIRVWRYDHITAYAVGGWGFGVALFAFLAANFGRTKRRKGFLFFICGVANLLSGLWMVQIAENSTMPGLSKSALSSYWMMMVSVFGVSSIARAIQYWADAYIDKMTPPDSEIRVEAYYQWERAGRPHGREVEFWHAARKALIEGRRRDQWKWTLFAAPE